MEISIIITLKKQPLLFYQETYTSTMTRITTIEQYHTDYQFALENPESFWEKQAKEFTWKKPWNIVLQ